MASAEFMRQLAAPNEEFDPSVASAAMTEARDSRDV
jgi:hypothetical protein